MTTYKIVRKFFDEKIKSRTIRTGLTEEEAKNHCNDLESSSDTCTKPENKRRTKRFSAWFDCYVKE